MTLGNPIFLATDSSRTLFFTTVKGAGLEVLKRQGLLSKTSSFCKLHSIHHKTACSNLNCKKAPKETLLLLGQFFIQFQPLSVTRDRCAQEIVTFLFSFPMEGVEGITERYTVKLVVHLQTETLNY